MDPEELRGEEGESERMSEGNTMRTDLSAMSAASTSEMLEESVSMQETMDMDD